MEKLIINGGTPLQGSVTISGAKNSAVALVPAALLADGPVVIENLPHIQDVEIYHELLREMGADVLFEDDWMEVDGRPMKSMLMPNGRVKKLRASYYLWGRFWPSSGKRASACREGATWGRVQSTCTLKGLKHSAPK